MFLVFKHRVVFLTLKWHSKQLFEEDWTVIHYFYWRSNSWVSKSEELSQKLSLFEEDFAFFVLLVPIGGEQATVLDESHDTETMLRMVCDGKDTFHVPAPKGGQEIVVIERD